MRLNWRLFVLIGASLALSSCSFLPAQGPSASDVVQQANAGDPERQPRYLITDLTPSTVAILRQVPNLTLAGRFGAHDGAPPFTIGVGDTVAVTLWEAASG